MQAECIFCVNARRAFTNPRRTVQKRTRSILWLRPCVRREWSWACSAAPPPPRSSAAHRSAPRTLHTPAHKKEHTPSRQSLKSSPEWPQVLKVLMQTRWMDRSSSIRARCCWLLTHRMRSAQPAQHPRIRVINLPRPERNPEPRRHARVRHRLPFRRQGCGVRCVLRDEGLGGVFGVAGWRGRVDILQRQQR